MFIIYNNDT